jgi:PIN domain nuclease of toxin-antitoxin system
MNVIIDTHAFIWFINGDSKLPNSSIKLIKDGGNKCFLSKASLWEIAIKVSLKKLELASDFLSLNDLITSNNLEILPISFNHLLTLSSLPFYHRDPFDRLIISQAKFENLTIISKDKYFALYPVKTLWD